MAPEPIKSTMTRQPHTAVRARSIWRRKIPTHVAVLAVAAIAPLLPGQAWADPNDYIMTLDYTGGEHELESKLGAASKARDGTPAGEAAALGYGQGVSDTWFTEVYVQFANNPAGQNGGGLDAASWENVVRFSEPGQWFADVGAMAELEFPRAGSQGWKLTTGPLLQKDIGDLQINANLLLQRQFDGSTHLATQLTYQLQLRYRSDPGLEFGMQAFGQMGTWNHWGQPQGQIHRIGPALFGEHKLSTDSSLHYNAAVLVGASRGAADVTVRGQIEYEY